MNKREINYLHLNSVLFGAGTIGNIAEDLPSAGCGSHQPQCVKSQIMFTEVAMLGQMLVTVKLMNCNPKCLH